jgi:hypothetical protein
LAGCGIAQRAAKAWRIGHVFPGSPSIVDHFADVFEERRLSHVSNRDFTVAKTHISADVGHYIISDKPMTEEQWITERTKLIEAKPVVPPLSDTGSDRQRDLAKQLE